jgi:nicotinamide-nucleotide amidase
VEPERDRQRPRAPDSGDAGQVGLSARDGEVDPEGVASLSRLGRPRAVVVLTGSELVRGDVRDANGPFLAGQLVSLGFDVARLVIVGDSPHELEPALAAALEADLCVVSGGLGPTHDDRTVETLARLLNRKLSVDPALEREIEAVSRAHAQRLQRPYADFAPGVRKQASLPDGAVQLGLAGTAPGLALEAEETLVVVLPGPPQELKRLWQAALESEPLRRVLTRTRPPERRVLRFYGVSESAVAQALEKAGGDGGGVEATICARDFEIHVDLLADEGSATRADEVAERLRQEAGSALFAEDERPIADHVLELCRARGLTLAAAESCTGGLVAARLTSIPGSSEVFLGSVVAYADDVKKGELNVPSETLAAHGAVSAETAEAMASGVRRRLQSDIGVSVTGVAGPGGGTPEKPVGLVYLHAEGPDGSLGGEFSVPADRETVRARATVAALHLVRRLLSQSRDGSV